MGIEKKKQVDGLENRLRFERLEKKLREVDSYNWLVGKYFRYFFIGMVVFLFLAFPNEKIHDIELILWIGIFVIITTEMYIEPYLYIRQNGVKVSIYACFKETAIKKKQFIKSRMKTYFTFLFKFFGTCFMVRMLIICCFEKLTIDYFIFVSSVILLYVLMASAAFFFKIYCAVKE